jgi:RNA polymerase sigma factor (sigma-70 family)
MSTDGSFDALMARIGAGDPEAAAELHRRYVRRLVGLARTRLDSRVRQKVGCDDVVQSVFRTFIRRQTEGEFELDGWGDLWSLLAVITLRKCGHQVRHFRTEARDIGRELVPDLTGTATDSWQGIARDPTPSEGLVMAETVEQLMRKLTERERPILELALQGYKAREISGMMRRSERTVYRVLECIKSELQRLRDGG